MFLLARAFCMWNFSTGTRPLGPKPAGGGSVSRSCQEGDIKGAARERGSSLLCFTTCGFCGAHASRHTRKAEDRDFGKRVTQGADGLGRSQGRVVGEEGGRKIWQKPGWKEGGRTEVTLVWVAGRAGSLCYIASGRTSSWPKAVGHHYWILLSVIHSCVPSYIHPTTIHRTTKYGIVV